MKKVLIQGILSTTLIVGFAACGANPSPQKGDMIKVESQNIELKGAPS